MSARVWLSSCSGEGGEIDTSGFESGVGRCEDREGAVALERLEEPGLDDCIDQRGVNAGRLEHLLGMSSVSSAAALSGSADK
jgi:hypothetical protein